MNNLYFINKLGNISKIDGSGFVSTINENQFKTQMNTNTPTIPTKPRISDPSVVHGRHGASSERVS
jgi:hypothetical protein